MMSQQNSTTIQSTPNPFSTTQSNGSNANSSNSVSSNNSNGIQPTQNQKVDNVSVNAFE